MSKNKSSFKNVKIKKFRYKRQHFFQNRKQNKVSSKTKKQKFCKKKTQFLQKRKTKSFIKNVNKKNCIVNCSFHPFKTKSPSKTLPRHSSGNPLVIQENKTLHRQIYRLQDTQG